MYFPAFEELGLPELLSIVAGLAFLLIIINYLLNYLPASMLKNGHIEKGTTNVPVTVIICARNEDHNLAEYLPLVLKQDYPEYEVVVVNDCSNDNTGNVVDELARTYPKLRKADIKEDAYYKHGKKFAVLVGIKSAKYNHLVFTDADCYPVSDQWLKQLAGGFTDKREIVLGYGAYIKEEGMLNSLIRYDTFAGAVQYFSGALRKRPSMGVGRNLAYTRDLFFNNKGFASHYHLRSGDDDLFVNETATSTNTNVCIQSDAVTLSRPKKTFREWRLQKARHLTTAPHYNASSKAHLAFSHFTQYFFLLSLVGLAFSLQTLLLIPILLLLKSLTQILIIKRAAARLGERDLLAGAPFYELILLFIYPIFQATKVFYKPNRWTN
jgi:cellulose synthase/poly-beta-1,6-N-acetylglucosamine synthase-like glycosyltransferase